MTLPRLRNRTLGIFYRHRFFNIAILMLLYGAALVYEAKHLGLTIDEPSHFAAAYMYWLGEDILEPADTPPLTRAISGWVPILLYAPDPVETKGWQSKDAYQIGIEILGMQHVRARRLLFYTRLPFIVFPLLIVFLIWHWARQLFGEVVALILAACACLEPTMLGHGALIKSDVPATFAALLFAYTAWRYWQTPTRIRLLFLTLASTMALLTKFTLLPLVFLGFLLALWKGPRLLAAVAMPPFFYFAVLAISQFKAGPLSALDRAEFPDPGVPQWIIRCIEPLANLPWPHQFIKGLTYVGNSMLTVGFPGYIMGRRAEIWEPSYFPLCWAIKFPIVLQLLMLAGLTVLCVRLWRRQAGAADAAIWGSAALYFGAGVMSNFHIGFRHVLPALPFFILGSGFAIELLWRHRIGKTVVAIGVALLAISSLRVYPNGISYFNEWIGGPTNGWRYLADSNLDWGQNYPELAAYVKQHPEQPVHTFLFSFDNLKHYTDVGTFISHDWPSAESPTGNRYQPEAGVYAISVDLLTGLVLPKGQEDFLAAFRDRQPVGRAGYSILIYRVE